VATMFYAIGDKSEDLIKTLDIDEQNDSYARITKKISEFYDQKGSTTVAP
jgi:septation ring formation regulator EzrA